MMSYCHRIILTYQDFAGIHIWHQFVLDHSQIIHHYFYKQTCTLTETKKAIIKLETTHNILMNISRLKLNFIQEQYYYTISINIHNVRLRI